MPFPADLCPAWRQALPDLGLPETRLKATYGEAWEKALFEQFSRFYAAVMATNPQMNLTRITEPQAFLYRHIIDALLLSRWIPAETALADLGSGLGVPALPLALARPDLHITALESAGKKCRFIQQTADLLGLHDRFTVLQGRCEELAHQKDHREQFPIITARALAALPTLLEWSFPFLKPQGQLLAIKGPRHPEEIASAQRALTLLKGKVSHTETSALPQLNGSTVVVIQKLAPTPSAYPRSQGLPSSKPL
jgi:16S rRNA (guanine527-N7)-methyltransferase